MSAGRVTACDNQPNPDEGSDGAHIRCCFSRDPAGSCASHSLVSSSQRAGWRAGRRYLVLIAKPGSLGLSICLLAPYPQPLSWCGETVDRVAGRSVTSRWFEAFLVLAITSETTVLFLMWRMYSVCHKRKCLFPTDH